MDRKLAAVIIGYVSLSPDQRREFREAVQEFEKEDASEKIATKSRLSPSVIKMELGPLEGGCPCCGR